MNRLYKFFIILLLLFGVIGQLAVISPSGNLDKNGDLLFWSSHGHDSMWHIAVVNEIQKGFPLTNPVFAGERLVNYHLFSDLLPAILNKLFSLPNLFLYFWLMPALYSMFLGLTAYLAGKEVGQSKLAGLFSVSAVYFIGSFGFMVTLLKGRGIGGESLFWATQIQSSIGNPPQIMSNILVLAFIYYLAKYLNTNNNHWKAAIIPVILLTSLTLSKIYAGMAVFPALGVLAIYCLLKDKKIDLLLITFIASLATLVLYLPFTQKAGNYLIFEPLWFVRRLFSDEGRIGISNFEFIIQHYQSLTSLKSKLGFARYDLLGLTLILLGNLGVRSLGFLAIPKIFKKNLQMGIFLLSVAFFSFLIPNLFLQKGVATNTSQTFQYLLLVFGIFFAVAAADIFKKIKIKPAKIFLLAFIFIFSVPTQIGLLKEFYSRPAFAKISSGELQALDYLKYNTTKKAVILTPPYDKYLDTDQVPPPIWDWFDTSYVSALSERRVYMADYEQVDIMGYDYRPRLEKQGLVFKGTDTNQVAQLLKGGYIDYLYFPKPLAPKVNFSTIPSLRKIFDNNEVEIWKVN